MKAVEGTEMDEESALAIIFANTKRHKRTVDLLTIAQCFNFLKNIYRTQEVVAEKTDLSREMVREFLQILKLPEYVKELIRSRKIDSIDTAYRLSKIKDEQTLATVVEKLLNLQTHDLRDVISAVKENAELSIDEATEAVLKSKPRNLHIFVLDFSEKNYKKIITIAKKEKTSPAELIKKIVEEWLSKVNEASAQNERL
jgi:hypothetical protein